MPSPSLGLRFRAHSLHTVVGKSALARTAFQPTMHSMWHTQTASLSTLVTLTHCAQVCANSHLGVPGGWRVRVLWVLNARCGGWEAALPEDTRERLRSDRESFMAGVSAVHVHHTTVPVSRSSPCRRCLSWPAADRESFIAGVSEVHLPVYFTSIPVLAGGCGAGWGEVGWRLGTEWHGSWLLVDPMPYWLSSYLPTAGYQARRSLPSEQSPA